MNEITDEGQRLAAELANDAADRFGLKEVITYYGVRLVAFDAIARICTRFLAMEADMREIGQWTDTNQNRDIDFQGRWSAIQAVAAKHRIVETDPLVEALNVACRCANGYGAEDAANLRAELAKRGIELGEAK
jgi:hypothetical protein